MVFKNAIYTLSYVRIKQIPLKKFVKIFITPGPSTYIPKNHQERYSAIDCFNTRDFTVLTTFSRSQ